MAAASVVLAQEESAPPLPLKLERALKPPVTIAPARTAPAPLVSDGLRLAPSRILSSSAAATPRLMPVEVLINGARAGDWVLLDVGGTLHATADAFEEWRLLRSPDVRAVEFRGELWYPLSATPGFDAQFFPATQSVQLKFSPSAFAATRLAQPIEDRPVVSRPLTSMFFNYDLNYTYQATRNVATTNDVGALTELGLSSPLGVLTNTSVGRNLAGDVSLAQRAWTRLETTFTRDFPDDNTTLRLGDSITRAATWGRQVYFGGVQLGRNFGLSPGFITQPVPSLTGQSTAPSTVELYINDALRQTSKVPTGPFTLDNYPILTGSGQARLVVRDVLGRETVVVQDFFSSSLLLKEGLSDWGAQAGVVRRNLGTESGNYGEGFGSGVYRYGVSNVLTLEAQGEASSSVQGGGVGVSVPLFGKVLGQAAFAGSHSQDAGGGALYSLGADHLSLRHGFTLHAERASRDYRRVGESDSLPTYRQQVLASYTYFGEELGHVGLAYGRVSAFDTGPVDTYSANYTLRILERSSLTFSMTRVLGPTNGVAFGVSVLIPFEQRTSVSGSANRKSGQTSSYVAASKTLGAEAGDGWRALAGRRAGQNYGEGGYYYQGRRGLVTADGSFSHDQDAVRLGAQGAIAAVDGELFVTRKLQDSYALVEVPGYSNVGVGFQSTVLTHTDENGRALVPRLLPYRRNSIRLDPTELPISAELDTIEMVAVPPARSAVKVTFPVRAGRGALVTILLEDGDVAPAGAQIALVGDATEFYVARRGEAFITGMQARNTLRLTWKNRTCDLQVELPPGEKDEIARLGPFTCRGVER